MASLKVALVQMRCEKGDTDANLAATERHIGEAVSRGAEVVCFPEASLTGYVDPVRYPGVSMRLDGPEVAQFVAMTSGRDVTAIAGFVEGNAAGAPYLTQIVARDGRLVAVYRKVTIPEEEVELYTPGSAATVFEHPAGTLGLAICADIDAPGVFASCAERGARVVFECAAPGLYGEQETRDWASGYGWWRGECFEKLGRYARENRISIAVATQAGRTRDEDFPGGGYVFAPNGACVAETADWAEGVLHATLALP